MTRQLNEARQRAATHQASRRMIARGDRPAYRVTAAEDGRWRVDTVPCVPVRAMARREALDEARAAIAEWLDVPPDAFDVEAGVDRSSGEHGETPRTRRSRGVHARPPKW